MGEVTFLSEQEVGKELENLVVKSEIKSMLGQNAEKYRFLLLRYKDVKNKAEWHDFTDDIYIIVSGSAVISTGGTLVNPRRLNENDIIADAITDAVVYNVKKGDVLLIPTKTPHQLDATGTEVAYVLVKVK